MQQVLIREGWSRFVFGLLIALSLLPRTSRAQHESHHGMGATQVDTLATAPTRPTRVVGDSGVVADSLLQACGPRAQPSIDDYSTCIGDALAALSSAGNIALAMGSLDRIIHSQPALILLAHPLAHALGYAVRSTPRTATALLSECDDRYQSGCYHGILQRYFDARIGMPIAQSVLVAPCDGFRGTREQFRLYDCLHGTGHGLMMYHGYDAAGALGDCDRLSSEWDQRSCYSGVFMEHNMAARMQLFGEGKYGMHRHAMPAKGVILFNAKDLQYPCDAIPNRYRHECYELQADLILPAVKQDYVKAAAVCDRAGATDLVRACYVGLGRNASGSAAFQYAGILKRCDRTSEPGRPYCYQGAVRHLAYAPSELPRGIAFCRALPDGEGRAQCWDGIGLQIAGFFADPASRARACQSDHPRDLGACIEGAGLGPGGPSKVRELPHR